MEMSMVLLFFVYGLAFFLLGFAIQLYPKKDSEIPLANDIWLIAAFGFAHGVNEWIDMFLVLKRFETLLVLRSILLPVSFLFLVSFGVKALAVAGKKYSILKALPALMLVAWAALTVLSANPFLTGDIWARYLIGAPGIFLTSYALLKQLRELNEDRAQRVRSHLLLAAAAFLFYGVFAGLIVPETGFFPANMVNYTVFLEKTGIRVQVFRALCAGAVTYGLVRTLEVFYFETKAKVLKSQKLFETIFDNAMDGILLADAETKKIYMGNRMMCKSLGFNGKECKDMGIADIHPEEALPQALEQFERVKRKEIRVAKDIPVKRKDGSVFFADISGSLITLEGRDYIISIFRDVTERKEVEERSRRHIEQLASLHSIDLAISSSLDLNVTLGVILNCVMNQLKVDAVDVLLYRPQTQLLEYAAGQGFRTEALRHTRLGIGESHAGKAALERRMVNVPDIREGEGGGGFERSGLLKDEGFVAYYGVPLVAKGVVNGVMEVFSRAPMDPDQEWLDFLVTLAGQTAIAIDNAMLFDNLQRSHTEIIMAYNETIEGWSRALDMRDRETEGHSQRVTELALRMARGMGLGEAELADMRRGALLHDIGKMGIPDSILLKPGPLDDAEMEIMRKHPVYGYDLLSPIRFLRAAIDIPYCHHERWDGTGYPRGLKGEEIPLPARIFALADIHDALSSARPYRPAWPREKIHDYLRSLSANHLDPRVVEIYFKMEKERLC